MTLTEDSAREWLERASADLPASAADPVQLTSEGRAAVRRRRVGTIGAGVAAIATVGVISTVAFGGWNGESTPVAREHEHAADQGPVVDDFTTSGTSKPGVCPNVLAKTLEELEAGPIPVVPPDESQAGATIGGTGLCGGNVMRPVIVLDGVPAWIYYEMAPAIVDVRQWFAELSTDGAGRVVDLDGTPAFVSSDSADGPLEEVIVPVGSDGLARVQALKSGTTDALIQIAASMN